MTDIRAESTTSTPRVGRPARDSEGRPAPSGRTVDGTARPSVDALEPPDRRWSGTKAFLLGWLLPCTTARRTQTLSLRRAFGAHVAAAIVAPLMIANLLVIAETPQAVSLAYIVSELMQAVDELVREFHRYPVVTVLTILGVIALVETIHVVLAFVVMAWGARDEPLRRSYQNAIRQVWLHTARVIPAACVIGAVAVPLSRMESAWNNAYAVPWPQPPQLPSNAVAGTPAWTAYNAEMQKYGEHCSEWLRERNRQKPWYLRMPEFVIIPTVFTMIIWFVWALLRAVGAPRHVAPISRPPMCDRCGYNLTTLAMESVCPECAEPVLASLGPDARPGWPWRVLRHAGRGKAFFRILAAAIQAPAAFARKLRVCDPGVEHRRTLCVPFPLIFLVGYAAVLAVFSIGVIIEGQRPSPFGRQSEVGFFAAPLFGAACCVGTLGVTLLAATVVGLIHSVREKRNLLPASIQVACGLVGYLCCWALFGALTGVVVTTWAIWIDVRVSGVSGSPGLILGMPAEFALPTFWLVPNIFCGLYYLVLLSRGTAATRYANR